MRCRPAAAALAIAALLASCGGGAANGAPTANRAPDANDAEWTTVEDQALGPIPFSGLDPDGDSLSFTVETPPPHGRIDIIGSAFLYLPAANWSGIDEFRFSASDGRLTSRGAVVRITVESAPDAPVASGLESTTPEDHPVDVVLRAVDADGDTLHFTIATPPAHGSVVLRGAVATYTPAADWSGTDVFAFSASDGSSTSAPASATVTVMPVNDPPVAVGDVAVTPHDRAVRIDVLANDLDVEGSLQPPTVVSAPAHGVATPEGGAIRYVPEPGFVGEDAFEYAVDDGVGAAATGRVTVRVIASGTLAETVPISCGGDVNPVGVARLADGSYVITGTFSETICLGRAGSAITLKSGRLQLTGAYFSRYDDDDVFVARFSPLGDVVWAKRAGGSGWDQTIATVALPDGSVVVGGRFEFEASFDDVTLESSPMSGFDAFLARYLPDGTLAWARSFGGDYQDEVSVLAVTPDGTGLLLGGAIEKSATLGAGEPSEQSFSGYTSLLARYTPEGRLVWAKALGGGAYDRLTGLAIAPDGGVLVAGYFGQIEGTVARFGVGEDAEVTLTSAGRADVFLARYSRDGSFEWAKQVTGAENEFSRQLVLSPDGAAVTMVGRFGHRDYGTSATATFGAGEPDEHTVGSAAGDAFVAQFDAGTGSLQWVRTAGGPSLDGALWISPVIDDVALVQFWFGGGATVGTGEPGEGSFPAAGYVMAAYRADGAVSWARTSELACGGALVRSADGAFAWCPAVTADGTAVVVAWTP
jgi:hypothetical protein